MSRVRNISQNINQLKARTDYRATTLLNSTELDWAKLIRCSFWQTDQWASRSTQPSIPPE